MHIYHKDGKDYPSVTTIIHCLGNEAITIWANRMGFAHKKYETILNDAADKGSKVHDWLRSIIDTSHTPEDNFKNELERINIGKIVTRFKDFIQLYKYDTIFTEKTFISEKMGYAGTLDWLATINDKYLMCLDFKTSKAVRFSMLLQLGGYSLLLKENGYNLDGAAIILANDKLCTMFPIGKTELDFYENAFLKIKDYYLFTMNKEPEYNKDMVSKLTNS